MKFFFNIFLIFILLVVLVPAFRNFIFYILVGRKLMKEQRKMNNQQQAARPGVKVDVRPEKEDSKFKGGEYVDFEEVKD